MNNISAVANYNKAYLTNKALKAKEQSGENPSVTAPSFKGFANKKSLNGLYALGAAALAAVGLKKSINNNVTLDEKYELAKQNNPELVAGLENQTHDIYDRDGWCGTRNNYSKDNILAIYNANNENPALAYKLATVLESLNYNYVNEQDTEYLLDKIKNNADIVDKYLVKGHPFETLDLLKAFETNPQSVDELFDLKDEKGQKRFNTKGIITLKDVYEKYPNQVKELAQFKNKNNKLMFCATDIASLAPKYDENKNFINKIYNLNSHWNIGELVKKCSEFPEITLKYMEKYPNESTYKVAELARLANEDETYVNLAGKNLEKAQDIINYAQNAISNKDTFDKIKKQNPKIKLGYEEIDKINKLKDEDKKQLARIIADGRCSSVEDMVSLIEIYKKFPNIKISDRLIEIHKNPNNLSNIFNI